MPQYNFGSGSLFTVPTTATTTPRRFGAIQEVTLDIGFDIKELYGQYQFPLDIARGKGKVTIKAKFGEIFADVFNQCFFGVTTATGMLDTIVDETGSIPDTPGPYTVTVAQSANFVSDLGVKINGVVATRVASAPTTGQYSVSAGVYTFAAADKTLAVLISYNYNKTGSGKKIVMANQFMGHTPKFACQLYTVKDSAEIAINFPNCVAGKLALPYKMDDYVIPELDIQALDNGSGTVMTISTTN